MGMVKEVVKVELTEEFKANAIDFIESVILKTVENNNVNLERKTLVKIRNLALDQVNVNVTSKSSSKTLWVLNTERSLPLIIEKAIDIPKLGELIPDNATVNGMYKLKPNLTWTYSLENDDGEGLDKKAFEDKVLKMFLEDVETAAFYGALSYIGEGDD